jgi:hypothetical protein
VDEGGAVHPCCSRVAGVHEARRQLKESLRREVWRHMRGVMEVLYEVYGYCRLAVKKLVELSWLVSATQMEQNSRRGRTDGMAGCLKWYDFCFLCDVVYPCSQPFSVATHVGCGTELSLVQVGDGWLNDHAVSAKCSSKPRSAYYSNLGHRRRYVAVRYRNGKGG